MQNTFTFFKYHVMFDITCVCDAMCFYQLTVHVLNARETNKWSMYEYMELSTLQICQTTFLYTTRHPDQVCLSNSML